MTFQTFQEFAEWCNDVKEINVVEEQEETSGRNNAMIIGDLHNTNGMLVCEILVSAYDSGFQFGPMGTDWYNGSIMIFEE